MALLRLRLTRFFDGVRLLPWPVRFGAAILFLNLMLLLPSVLDPLLAGAPDPPWGSDGWGWLIRRPGQDVFRLHVDLFILLAAAGWVVRNGRPTAARRVAAGLILLWGVYETYDALVRRLFHRSGILYDDANYLVNGFYLALDLLTPLRALIGLAVAAWLGLVLWIAHRALLVSVNLLRRARAREVVVIVALLAMAAYIPLGALYGFTDPGLVVRSTTVKMARNAAASLQMHRDIRGLPRLPVDTLYAGYGRLRLSDPPSIYLLMIESYGSALGRTPALQARYRDTLRAVERSLSDAGWVAASAYSTAPVYGGRSWISIGAVLGGIELANSTEHALFMDRLPDFPHLVRFLDRQGYTTATIQPANRRRPGLPLENIYGFDREVYFDDLAYPGPPMGLWTIPDQYSLARGYELAFRDTDGPEFLFFETVSSHAPWSVIPPYLNDASSWSDVATPAPEEAPDNLLDAYFRSIGYDLRVVQDFMLARADSQAVVVIIGDHQPPLLGTEDFDTPLHILTRDPTLLDLLPPRGFTTGMIPPPSGSAAMDHEGLYSMLVHLLVAREPSSRTVAPPFRPGGASKRLLADPMDS